MRTRRRIPARFVGAAAVRSVERVGVALTFESLARESRGERIEDFADLGAEKTLASAAGLARLLRVARAGRVAAPRPAERWLGAPEAAAERLATALGAPLVLDVVARLRLRVTLFTEDEPIAFEDVADVASDPREIVVRRRGHRLPHRVARERVVRQLTERETWLQIVGVERA
jgi:hypothetical protein